MTCGQLQLLQGESPERSESASEGNGGNEAGDADGDQAYRDYGSGDDWDSMPALVYSSDDDGEDADDEAGDCEHESADELDLSDAADADYDIESVDIVGDLDSPPGLVHSSEDEASDSDDADDNEIQDPDEVLHEDGFKHDRSNDEDDEDSDDLPGLIADCRALLDADSEFCFLTAYAVRMSALAIGGLMEDHFGDLPGKVEFGELAVREEARGRLLPTAIFARWSRRG